jgi:hypothetical protein
MPCWPIFSARRSTSLATNTASFAPSRPAAPFLTPFPPVPVRSSLVTSSLFALALLSLSSGLPTAQGA